MSGVSGAAAVGEREDPWSACLLLSLFLYPSLREIGEIINRSRFPAVHAKESIPVPSPEQAAMVINAMIDTVRRTLVAR